MLDAIDTRAVMVYPSACPIQLFRRNEAVYIVGPRFPSKVSKWFLARSHVTIALAALFFKCDELREAANYVYLTVHTLLKAFIKMKQIRLGLRILRLPWKALKMVTDS